MNELDDYMDIHPKDPSFDIEKVIAHHRRYRAQIEGGVKPKRAKKDTGPKIETTLDTKALLASIMKANPSPEPKPADGFKRRV